MIRLFPHPVLSLCLIFLWLMLTRFSLGYLILGTALSLVAGWAYSALHSAKPRIRRWQTIPRLAATLVLDIIRSNAAITRLLLTEGRNGRTSAFIQIPLQITSPNALAVLAIILTATPGTAWVEYGTDTGILTLHIFDASEADHYHRIVGQTYEPMLMEIFE
ncbi:putative monovalent cation/H+ antiporter subunit E [Paracoccus haematequi]|uniref:Putative monovalent cation/H+ antiporter subunit E n=1 Tax=Paracoccus haematequi TaxID=2491866 RepID=A0A3S4CIU9_9RHOB|nr:Na+/H+ antiporter subunit E [Paracoccus haematequi]VDS08142.1 putative monovalent cation/H+ antiporter subunit E [Paracoccus haematequi]